MNEHKYKSKTSDAGFTLVEILVTITIMVILTALLIPNVRTVTKDRNAREAARLVGSIMSQASQRAVNDGVAGIVLFRNQNYLVDANMDGNLDPAVDLQFAVDRIALLRRVPEYTGDTTGAIAMLSPTPPAPATAIARIPLPIEQDDLRLIAPSDTLSLNNNRFEYPIRLVTKIPATGLLPAFLDITVDVSEYPDPTALLMAGVQFVVNRSPRVLRSSEVTLPADYVIDLRFSGFDSTDSVLPGANPLIPANVPGFNSTVFELAPAIPNSALTGVVNFVNQPIAVLFNQDGAVSQMGVNTAVLEPPSGGGPPELVDYAYTTRAQGRLFLFVTEYDADSISAGTPSNPLLNDRNLWVSASSTNGTVNVGTNSTSDTPAGLTLDELRRRYIGTFSGDMLTDRNVFNGFISSARSDSVSASAVQ